MKGDAELAALVVAVDGDAELEVALGEAMGRFRRRREQWDLEAEAARLLPTHGANAVAELQCVDRVTVYRRAKRATRRFVVALRSPVATGT
jgi:triphosphoribosyl-dephospho-CoA synthetase